MEAAGKEPLVRVTVNLIPRASRALTLGTDSTGYSKTDFMNRAVQAYAYMEHVVACGGEILVRDPENDELVRLKFMLCVFGAGREQLQLNTGTSRERRLRPAPRVILPDRFGVEVLP